MSNYFSDFKDYLQKHVQENGGYNKNIDNAAGKDIEDFQLFELVDGKYVETAEYKEMLENGNGSITKDDFTSIFEESGVSKEEAEAIYDFIAGQDGDDVMSKEEFETLASLGSHLVSDGEYVDKDRNGVTFNEHDITTLYAMLKKAENGEETTGNYTTKKKDDEVELELDYDDAFAINTAGMKKGDKSKEIKDLTLFELQEDGSYELSEELQDMLDKDGNIDRDKFIEYLHLENRDDALTEEQIGQIYDAVAGKDGVMSLDELEALAKLGEKMYPTKDKDDKGVKLDEYDLLALYKMIDDARPAQPQGPIVPPAGDSEGDEAPTIPPVDIGGEDEGEKEMYAPPPPEISDEPEPTTVHPDYPDIPDLPMYAPPPPGISEEPETSDEPGITDDPEISEDPETSDDPSVTSDPETSDDPGVTSDPETSDDPSVTSDPETSDDPSVTSDPETSDDPSVTSDPETSDDPGVTSDPETSDDPGVTSDPETSDDPGVTSDPETSDDPGVTSDPETSDDPGVTSDPETSDDPGVTSDPETSTDPGDDPIPSYDNPGGEDIPPAPPGGGDEPGPNISDDSGADDSDVSGGDDSGGSGIPGDSGADEPGVSGDNEPDTDVSSGDQQCPDPTTEPTHPEDEPDL